MSRKVPSSKFQVPSSKRVQFLGVGVDDLGMEEVIGRVNNWLLTSGNKKHYIVTVNPEFLVSASKDSSFKKILNQADLAVTDGFGLRLASGFKVKNRVAGTDLVSGLSGEASAQGWRLGLIGATAGVAKKAASILKSNFQDLKIDFALDGEEADFYLDLCMDTSKDKQSKGFKKASLLKRECDILFVAFGAPKQERFIYRLVKEKNPLIEFKVAIGVGGVFDYLAGVVPRAPVWMRKLGFEWLYRLIKEPKKRGKRVYNAVIVFPFLVLKEKIINWGS